MKITQWVFAILCILCGFQSTAAFGAPVVIQVTPNHGPIAGGTAVDIFGSGFTGVTAIDFGVRSAASFALIDDGHLQAISPLSSTGTVTVSVTTASGTSPTSSGSYYAYQGDQLAFMSIDGNNQVIPIDTATNTSLAGISVGNSPLPLAITPDGTKVYVCNQLDTHVSVIDIATQMVIATVTVGNSPSAIAITPDGGEVYVVNRLGFVGSVSIIDTASQMVIAPVLVGIIPNAIAITPDGAKVYVVNQGLVVGVGSVSIIDTTSQTVIATVTLGKVPNTIVITPDGTQAYVANYLSNNVSVIDTASQIVIATLIVGVNPTAIAITPDGMHAYVANSGSKSVSVIDTASQMVIATPTVGISPTAIGITPDGMQAYVVNSNSSSVSVIDTASQVVIATVSLGMIPTGIAITPDGMQVYVSNAGDDNVSVIETSLNMVITTISLSDTSPAIALIPDQPPIAVFTAVLATVGLPSQFDATASVSPIGTIVNYFWDFGDENMLNTPSPLTSHTYLAAGSYPVTLIVTNSAGTSTQKIYSFLSNYFAFLGPFSNNSSLTNNGGPSAVNMQLVTILPPLPVVTSLIPPLGPTTGGTSVTILGSNFTGATGVFFGSNPAVSFTVNSDNSITAISPPGVVGPVDVIVITPGGISALSGPAELFTYFSLPIVNPPIITSLSPPVGPLSGGTSVTILGSHFTGTTAVFFGPNPASSFTVNSDMSITAISPPGIRPGPVEVIVITPAGTSASNPLVGTFTYQPFAPLPPAPPANFKGKQVKNIFADQIEYIHHLHWKPSPDLSVVGYRLFRNGELIATISSKSSLMFDDNNRKKHRRDRYDLVAFTVDGRESQAVTLTLP